MRVLFGFSGLAAAEMGWLYSIWIMLLAVISFSSPVLRVQILVHLDASPGDGVLGTSGGDF